MDDLSAIINKILNDPESMRQLQQVGASLGLSGGGQQSQAPPPAQNSSQNAPRQSSAPLNWTMGGNGRGNSRRQNQPAQQKHPEPSQSDNDITYIKNMLEQLVENTRSAPAPAMPQGNAGGLDLSALSGILGNLGATAGAPGPSAPAQSQGGGLDLSALSGILGSLGVSSGNNAAPDLNPLSGVLGNLAGSGKQDSAPSSGVSALTAMLGGNESAGGASSSGGGMNMNMLLKFQQAISSISSGAENVRLMMALKGHLKDEARINKVDDAVKVMQVIQFLPLLKDSGIFKGFDEMLSGFNLGGLLGGSQSTGGPGGILGNLGAGGLGGILNALTGRR